MLMTQKYYLHRPESEIDFNLSESSHEDMTPQQKAVIKNKPSKNRCIKLSQINFQAQPDLLESGNKTLTFQKVKIPKEMVKAFMKQSKLSQPQKKVKLVRKKENEASPARCLLSPQAGKKLKFKRPNSVSMSFTEPRRRFNSTFD